MPTEPTPTVLPVVWHRTLPIGPAVVTRRNGAWVDIRLPDGTVGRFRWDALTEERPDIADLLIKEHADRVKLAVNEALAINDPEFGV